MNWPPQRDSEADVSSVRPLSERIGELFVFLCLFTRNCTSVSFFFGFAPTNG